MRGERDAGHLAPDQRTLELVVLGGGVLIRGGGLETVCEAARHDVPRMTAQAAAAATPSQMRPLMRKKRNAAPAIRFTIGRFAPGSRCQKLESDFIIGSGG